MGSCCGLVLIFSSHLAKTTKAGDVQAVNEAINADLWSSHSLSNRAFNLILSICPFIHLFYFSLLQGLKYKDEVDNACPSKQSKRKWTQRRRGVKPELPHKLAKQVEKSVSLRDQLNE